MICDRTIHPSNYTSFPRDPMVLNNNNNNSTLKMQRCREYMKALESEKRKIQVFERELPLCLELVTQAIEGCKQQMCGTTTDYFNGQSDCSEQTSSDGPVLEEFIPVKSNLCVDDEEEEDHDDDGQEKAQLYDTSKISCSKLDKSSFKKLDWLRSAQLSIQTPDPVDLSPKRVPVVEVKRNGCGAFHPFKKENCSGSASATQVVKISSDQMADASSTAETGSGGDVGSKSDDKGQSNRKTRRCWSPELHRRFLHALQQLGGSHVATPKQIRELMKVDGLTNDEVKSHLQKYRLHTRRPNSTIDNNQQTPQFVVVGGLWMPPPEYATMAGNSTQTSGDTNNPKGVYAPIASHPPPMEEASMSINKNDSSDKDDGNSHNDSPSTSSSTHTTTNSPAF